MSEVQIIKKDGKPAFVVVPIELWERMIEVAQDIAAIEHFDCEDDGSRVPRSVAVGERAGQDLMRRPLVESLVGLSTSSLYDLMARNQFPKPVKIGVRRVAWRSADVMRWIEERR